MSQKYQIPDIPRVTSPTPPPSNPRKNEDGYFGPITRSTAARLSRSSEATDAISEEAPSDSSLEERSRARSRSPRSVAKQSQTLTGKSFSAKSPPQKDRKPSVLPTSNGQLSPSSAAPPSSSYWRNISRSPSPLGLIPIHRHWRSFIHRHEIPRKVLHVSIGFFTLHLYAKGTSPASIHPWLLRALIPIATTDFLRHQFPPVNQLYIRVLGALMRESEVTGWNGVIWYLLGAWSVLRFLPKDVGVMGVLLLSWCDTAASTVGRLYERYTPRIREGKSLAGSAAAALVGMVTAGLFWGWAVPHYGYDEDFMFHGVLTLPAVIKHGLLGWTKNDGQGVVGGWLALGIVSVYSGLVASISEVVDLFGWDDNLTIPVLSGVGLWGFFRCFGM